MYSKAQMLYIYGPFGWFIIKNIMNLPSSRRNHIFHIVLYLHNFIDTFIGFMF
jgi:hypothetical protein